MRGYNPCLICGTEAPGPKGGVVCQDLARELRVSASRITQMLAAARKRSTKG